MGLDRLFDAVIDFLYLFRFWKIIDVYEKGVVLRFGKPKRVLGPGFHLKMPFNIEVVLTDNVVPTTEDLGIQSLVTADQHEITLRAIVHWRISDIEKILLEVEDSDSVLEDTVSGLIGSQVLAHNLDEVLDESFVRLINRTAKRQAKKFGIDIVRIQFAELTTASTLRVMGDGPAVIDDE